MDCTCKYHGRSLFIVILVLILHLFILLILAIYAPNTLEKSFLPPSAAEVILQESPLNEWAQLNAAHHETPHNISTNHIPQENMQQEVLKEIIKHEENDAAQEKIVSDITDDGANSDPTYNTTILKEPVSQPQEKPRSLPFSQLLQGALAQWNQGTDQYTMQGKKTGKATAEQLKRAAYFTKIMESIRSSLITHTIHKPLCAAEARIVIVALSLLPEGAINTIAVHTSSGNHQIDLFIVRIVKDAASSFPPVPKSFNPQDYHFTIRFNDIINLIEHPQSARISV